jgi:type IV pilus assembly protein PilM
MFLTNPFPKAFGLDIGDLSIKLIQFRRHHFPGKPAYFSVAIERSISLPSGAILNGEILQPEIIRKKILHLLGKDGAYPDVGTSWVVANLPEPKTFLKLIEIPTPAKDLVYDEVSFHASKHLPFDIQDTYLDWQLLNSEVVNSKVSQVLIAGVPKVITDSYTYLLESADLNPIALEAEAIAVARTLITGTKNYAGIARALLDLGGTRSSLIIYDKDSIQFSHSLNFSGELLTTAISLGLKISREEAETLKIATGLAYSTKYPNYVTIVDGIVEGLVKEINETLHFYKEHFVDTNTVTHITMCGGLSNLINLDSILSKKLRISAKTGNVWKNVTSEEITDARRREGLNYAVAIGLALRAAENPLVHLNI